VTEYRGLTVAQLNKLRRELQGAGASYRVTKNTLTRRAIKETAFAKLDELLRGPTGLVTTAKDPVAVAKILVRFAEQNDKLKINGGVLDGEPLPASSVSALAKLPSREVLIAQLLACFKLRHLSCFVPFKNRGRRWSGSSGRSKRPSRHRRGPSAEVYRNTDGPVRVPN